MTYWMQTFTGRKIDLLAPKPEDVDIEDIAHALSMICRFNGHCRDFYSVAEHSMLVEMLSGADFGNLPRSLEGPSRYDGTEVRLCGLLHDAAEAYVGDLCTPVKRSLVHLEGLPAVPSLSRGTPFDDLEDRWLRAIGQRFDLGSSLASTNEIVKESDDKALAIEVVALFSPVLMDWWTSRERPCPGDATIQCWPPAEARRRFVHRFRQLTMARGEKAPWHEIGGPP